MSYWNQEQPLSVSSLAIKTAQPDLPENTLRTVVADVYAKAPTYSSGQMMNRQRSFQPEFQPDEVSGQPLSQSDIHPVGNSSNQLNGNSRRARALMVDDDGDAPAPGVSAVVHPNYSAPTGNGLFDKSDEQAPSMSEALSGDQNSVPLNAGMSLVGPYFKRANPMAYYKENDGY